jgi:hypothetical protein
VWVRWCRSKKETRKTVGSQHQLATMVNLLIKLVRAEEKGSGLSVAIRYPERCYYSRRYCMVKVGMQRVNVGMDDDDVFDE